MSYWSIVEERFVVGFFLNQRTQKKLNFYSHFALRTESCERKTSERNSGILVENRTAVSRFLAGPQPALSRSLAGYQPAKDRFLISKSGCQPVVPKRSLAGCQPAVNRLTAGKRSLAGCQPALNRSLAGLIFVGPSQDSKSTL